MKKLLSLLLLISFLFIALSSCTDGGVQLGSSDFEFNEVYSAEKIASSYYGVKDVSKVSLGRSSIEKTDGKIVVYTVDGAIKFYNIDDNNVYLALDGGLSRKYSIYDGEYTLVISEDDATVGTLYNSRGDVLVERVENADEASYSGGILKAGKSVHVLRSGKVAVSYSLSTANGNHYDPDLYVFGASYAHRITNSAVVFFGSDMSEVSRLELPLGASDVSCYTFGDGMAMIFYRTKGTPDSYDYANLDGKWNITQGVFDIKRGKLSEIDEDVMIAYVLENREESDLSELGITSSIEYFVAYLPIVNKALLASEDDLRISALRADGKIGYAIDGAYPDGIGIPVSFVGAGCYAQQTELGCDILSPEGDRIASFDGEDIVLKKSFGYMRVKQKSAELLNIEFLDEDGETKTSVYANAISANGYDAVIYSTVSGYYYYDGSEDEPVSIATYLGCGVYHLSDGRIYDLYGNDIFGEELYKVRLISATDTTLLIRVSYDAVTHEYKRIIINGGE